MHSSDTALYFEGDEKISTSGSDNHASIKVESESRDHHATMRLVFGFRAEENPAFMRKLAAELMNAADIVEAKTWSGVK